MTAATGEERGVGQHRAHAEAGGAGLAPHLAGNPVPWAPTPEVSSEILLAATGSREPLVIYSPFFCFRSFGFVPTAANYWQVSLRGSSPCACGSTDLYESARMWSIARDGGCISCLRWVNQGWRKAEVRIEKAKACRLRLLFWSGPTVQTTVLFCLCPVRSGTLFNKQD